MVLGAGMQGTLYGVRLALAGHSVVLVVRGSRAAELRRAGAVIEDALSGERQVARLEVAEAVDAGAQADLCLVTVRREQLAQVLPGLRPASRILRILFFVNHACGSEFLFDAVGRGRTVLGFPGAAGSIEEGIDRYVEIREQPTVIESRAEDLGEILRRAGFRVSRVRDMDSWLRRHAAFVTAISGALYEAGADARRLARDRGRVRHVILGIREAWAAMDQRAVGPAPFALRAIFEWVPLAVAVRYWQRLLGSERGEYYFARHARHAPVEMAALAQDVRELLHGRSAPHLLRLYAAIDRAAGSLRGGCDRRGPS
jgi:2-dehydropantoate 2-reductase